jgi:hypothetical protein
MNELHCNSIGDIKQKNNLGSQQTLVKPLIEALTMAFGHQNPTLHRQCVHLFQVITVEF